MPTNDTATWPLWACLPDEAIIKLVLYQWDRYRLKLEFLANIYAELEPLEELEKHMRQRPHFRETE